MDPAVLSGIREALEPVRSGSGRIVALRRDVYKVKGRWSYLYHAADKHVRTVDFLLAAKREWLPPSAGDEQKR